MANIGQYQYWLASAVMANGEESVSIGNGRNINRSMCGVMNIILCNRRKSGCGGNVAKMAS